MPGGTLPRVQDAADRAGATVLRSWPKDADCLLVELQRDGRVLAGQWFADAERAARTADRTGARAEAVDGLVLQPDGADRRLPALAALVAAPGARLVVHRPERRGVVLGGDGTWTKVVRPERLAALAAAAGAPRGVRTPRVLHVDAGRGTLTTAALPGRPLHDVLHDGGPGAVARAATAVGSLLARLHAGPTPAGAPCHDAAAEHAVLHRWAGHAAAHGLPFPTAVLPDVDRLLAGPAEGLVPLHRDLHDKQVLVDDDGTAGVLDLDLAALGEPALDLANLLVHLELRALQGWCDAAAAEQAAAGVLEAYAPAPPVLARVPAYAASTWLRLTAVYAFRPGSHDLLPELARRAAVAGARR